MKLFQPTRTRRCTCTHVQWPPAEEECRRGHLIEEHPWYVEPEFYAPWSMQPIGPFRIQRHHECLDPRMVRQHVCSTMDDAADWFLTMCMPVSHGWVATVMDESYRVVLASTATTPLMESFGHPAWFGVEAGFDALERVGAEPMDVAVWSKLARGTAR